MTSREVQLHTLTLLLAHYPDALEAGRDGNPSGRYESRALTHDEELWCVASSPLPSSTTAVPKIAVEKLLEALTDADEGTAGVVWSLIGRGCSEGDVAWALECATGPGVKSPSSVAVAELKKRLVSRRKAG